MQLVFICIANLFCHLQLIKIRDLMLQCNEDASICLRETLLMECDNKSGKLITCLQRIHPDLFSSKLTVDFNKVIHIIKTILFAHYFMAWVF